jgi:hypothetical protein
VAVICGFASQSHLTDVFVKFVGHPPGRYRSMVAQRANIDSSECTEPPAIGALHGGQPFSTASSHRSSNVRPSNVGSIPVPEAKMASQS